MERYGFHHAGNFGISQVPCNIYHESCSERSGCEEVQGPAFGLDALLLLLPSSCAVVLLTISSVPAASRVSVLRSLRLLLRPRERAWRHTKLSIICTNFVLKGLFLRMRHLSVVVSTARNSRTLICSGERHPITVFHFQRAAGRLARSR